MMKRVTMTAGLFAVALLLSGCDKCGDAVKFFQGPSTSCGDTRPAG